MNESEVYEKVTNIPALKSLNKVLAALGLLGKANYTKIMRVCDVRSYPTVYNIIAVMENHGLVVTEKNNKETLVKLTEKGKKLADAILDVFMV